MCKWNGIAYRKHPDYKIYKCWNSMKQRCYDTKCNSYKNYGGRGITMCDEWLNDFLIFYKWAKENNFKEGLQIDRIDNNGNYSPDNCQFVTNIVNMSVGKRRKQTNNKSGYVGVYFCKDRNKWMSQITINKKQINLGYYSNIPEALQARIKVEIFYFGEQVTNL